MGCWSYEKTSNEKTFSAYNNIENKLFHRDNGIKAIIAINLIEIAIFITMIKKYYFPRDQYDNNISCGW